MCGICGVWGTHDLDTIQAMVRAMTHRGPDDRGTFTDHRVGLGMSRLAVLDPSPAGHQPMSNEDGGVWIVYNGEVSNFIEQRHHLEGLGHRFRSNTDTEVVLRSYEQHGDDCVRHLRGMFAFAIYDRRDGNGRERLLLARDQFGIKPLLFTWRHGRLLFASELKALVAADVPAAVDPESLRLLLATGSVPQPRTLVADVHALLPSHRLVLDAGGVRSEPYWRLATDRHPELLGAPYEDQRQAVAAAVDESLRLQLASDVPLGAFLSGGVDSALLVALMSRHATGRVHTFSVGFGGEGSAIDESADAERTARHLGTEHHHVWVTGREVADDLTRFVRGLDQPSVDGLNSYFISKAARLGVTVAISGTGGDELFAGYPWFAATVLEEELRARRPIRSAWTSLAGRMTAAPALDGLLATAAGAAIERLRRASGLPARLAGRTALFGARAAQQLLAADLGRRSRSGRAIHHDIAWFDDPVAATPQQRTTALTLRGYTANQLLRDIDATSMAHSLEVRVPLLDPAVADVALSLPDTAKLGETEALARNPNGSYRDTGAKRILIDAHRSLLPPGIDRQHKRGFALPIGEWLRGPLAEPLADCLSEQSVRSRGLLDPVAVSDLHRSFRRGGLSWNAPWLLMVLELWCREMIDGGSRGET